MVILAVCGRIHPVGLLPLADSLGARNLSESLMGGIWNHHTLCTKYTKTATTEIAI